MSISVDDNITILNTTNNSLIVKSTANAANMEFMLGSNDENTNIIVKDNQTPRPGILHRMPASGQYLTKNSLHPKILIESYNTEGAQAYSIRNIVNGIITRDCNGAARTDTFPSATSIISAIPNCQVGTMFTLLIRNTSTADHTLTITLGAGFTSTDVLTVSKGTGVYWTFVVTSVDSPAISGFIQSNPDIVPDAAPPAQPASFSNSHSLKFVNADGGQGAAENTKAKATIASPTTFPFYRAANGSGSSDAWSISFWLKQVNQNVTGNGYDLMFAVGSSLAPAINVVNIW